MNGSTPEDSKIDIGAEVNSLLEAWCNRQVYGAICLLYGGHRSLNGLTDGWEDFVASLKRLRTFCMEHPTLITEAEAARVRVLIGLVSRRLNG